MTNEMAIFQQVRITDASKEIINCKYYTTVPFHKYTIYYFAIRFNIILYYFPQSIKWSPFNKFSNQNVALITCFPVICIHFILDLTNYLHTSRVQFTALFI